MALSLGGLGTPAGSFRRVKANKTMPGGIVENGALREMGKSALVIAGLGLGIVKIAQMKKLKRALAALERRTEALEFHASDAVTQRNIDSAIKEAVEEHARVSLHRFSQQEAFTEALRAMVSRTDELLGRILEQMEPVTSPWVVNKAIWPLRLPPIPARYDGMEPFPFDSPARGQEVPRPTTISI